MLALSGALAVFTNFFRKISEAVVLAEAFSHSALSALYYSTKNNMEMELDWRTRAGL